MIPDQLGCRACGAAFNTPMELEQHMRFVHSHYGCVTCGQTFGSEDELDAHNRDMHPEKQKTPTD